MFVLILCLTALGQVSSFLQMERAKVMAEHILSDFNFLVGEIPACADHRASI